MSSTSAARRPAARIFAKSSPPWRVMRRPSVPPSIAAPPIDLRTGRKCADYRPGARPSQNSTRKYGRFQPCVRHWVGRAGGGMAMGQRLMLRHRTDIGSLRMGDGRGAPSCSARTRSARASADPYRARAAKPANRAFAQSEVGRQPRQPNRRDAPSDRAMFAASDDGGNVAALAAATSDGMRERDRLTVGNRHAHMLEPAIQQVGHMRVPLGTIRPRP